MGSPSPAVSSPPGGKLLTRVRWAIRARQYSRRTEEAYVLWVKRFVRFHGMRHPVALGPEDVSRFLTSLAVEGNVAPSTQGQATAALLFLYCRVLGRSVGWLEGIVRAKKPHRLPVVLTRAEVRALLAELGGARKLRRHAAALAERGRRVPLPAAFARKSPAAATEWGWQWLFPARADRVSARTGERVRWHVHGSAVQRAALASPVMRCAIMPTAGLCRLEWSGE